MNKIELNMDHSSLEEIYYSTRKSEIVKRLKLNVENNWKDI